MSDQKHLTLEGRIIIEKGLDNRLSFKAIALSLNKDCTTISKEVRGHLSFEKTGSYGRSFNDCLHRKGCPRTGVCTACIKKQKRPLRCCFCGRCTSRCPDYEKAVRSLFSGTDSFFPLTSRLSAHLPSGSPGSCGSPG